MIIFSAPLSGCGFFSTNPEGTDDPTSAADAAAKEAPALAAQVESGALPALTERLPASPLVVDSGQPGRYGGTLTAVTLGPGDDAAFARIVGYEPPLRKNPALTEIIPNVCTDIEANEDGTEFTLRLREGLRWSDGEPFTADDIVFAIEDVWGDPELSPAPPSYLSQDGELAGVRKIDDATVTITFPGPNGTFRDASTRTFDLLRFPKHYASRLLPKYNSEAEKEAKEKGFETWTDYWEDMTGGSAQWNHPEFPVLYAWTVVQPLGEGNRVVFERNPYYWKTDQDGRQLPYLDKISFEVVQDPEVMVLKATSGELGLVYRHINNPANKPVFAASRKDGDYQIVDNKTTLMNTMVIALNLANKNKDRRELYQNKDFRIGLSHAINRQELITAVWQRQGEPWQVAPTKDSIYYDEEFAKQYTEYDVELAKDFLDRAGISATDKQGFRTLPGGDNLTITLDIATAMFEEWPAAASMIKDMWGEVGIRLHINTIDRTLFTQRRVWDVNETDAGAWAGDGGMTDEVEYPYWYLPFSDGTMWGTPWGRWYSSRGESGTKPVPAAQEQIELYWKLERTPEAADREEIFRQILAIAKDEFWCMGIGSAPDPYLLVRNNLKNVVGDVPDTYTYYSPGHVNPETWFLQP